MGQFRAIKVLQAPSLGLVRPGQEFEWGGSIIGWHVEPLDDDARRMVEERAKVLEKRGEAVVEKPLPTRVFPAGIEKQHSGMAAPAIVAGTMGIETPAPDANAPNMSAPPRRRKAAT